MFQGKPASGKGSALPAALYTTALCGFIVASRWPLAPRHLYYFDSANFAYALERFDPALHQPQPPGYPLFVALTRLIHFWVVRPEEVFLIAGLLAACAATALMRVLAGDMFGRTAGILAATLLASNPTFWFGGITNEIRTFLALSTTGVALLAWRALSRPDEPRWFYAACAALGVAAGFRPVESVLLSLILVWVWFQTGRSTRRLVLGLTALALMVAPWLIAVLFAVGGVHPFTSLLWQYALAQFSGTSAAFGATRGAAWHMFAEAVVWNFLGALAWIWALPFLPRIRPDRRKAAFLAVLFLPFFLFSAFIHIGDPDQALGSIPVLSVVGGAVLAAVLERWNSRRIIRMACAVIVIHMIIFFHPPGKLARASSYRAAKDVDFMTNRALDSIEALDKKGPLTIVHYGSSVGSRQVSYYFPDDYVVILPGSPQHPALGQPVQLYYHHLPLPAPPPGTKEPMLAGSRGVVCLLPWNDDGKELASWQKSGSVYYHPVSSTPILVGPYTFSAGKP